LVELLTKWIIVIKPAARQPGDAETTFNQWLKPLTKYLFKSVIFVSLSYSIATRPAIKSQAKDKSF